MTKDYYKNYYKKNKERILKRNKLHRLKNKKSISNKRKEYYKLNKENLLNCAKVWRENNKDKKIINDKIYYEENKEVINNKRTKYTREKRRSDLSFRIKGNLSNRIYKAIKGIHKSSSSLNFLGCSIEELKIHLEKQFREGMTWENYGKWHIDHIKPCASFNLLLEEEQRKCFHYTNLQPLWAEDNLKKHKKIVDEEYIKNRNVN